MQNTISIHDNGTTPTSALLKKCRDKFPVYSYWNDKELDEQFPPPKEPTTRSFLDSVEPDKENLGKSRNDMGDTPIMTLREYILMWTQSDKKFDVEVWTILSDRLPDGRVARGYWHRDNRRVCVDWCYAGLCDPDDGARSAIPFTPQTLNPSRKFYDPTTGAELKHCPTCGRD